MPPERAKLALSRMGAPICRESFYTDGTWTDEAGGVYVGWTARAGAFDDGMPIFNERRDVTLIFSGEEHPAPGFANRLRERGHAWGGEEASYLVHAYEDLPDFPAGLNGLFHGLVIDHRRQAVTLFNDRYGLHRLYYHESEDAFFFAAEAKAILVVRPELRAIDLRSLGEFVSCGCVLENRSLFRGVHVLPGGSAWFFRNGALELKRTYFEPLEWEHQTPLNADDYYRELRTALSQNMPRYFNGRQRVGLALTGGLDTRLILACRKPQRQSLPCYTFGSEYRESADVRLAKRVAEACELSHETISTGHEFLSRFAHYAERTVYATDGTCALNRAPDLYVSERAREIAPVKVVGTYGSEMLTTGPAFKASDHAQGFLDGGLNGYLQQARATYTALCREHPVTFAAFRQSPWWHFGTLALEETQLTVRSPFLDTDFVRAVYRLQGGAGMNRDVRWRLISEANRSLAKIPTDRGVGGYSRPMRAATARAIGELAFKAEYAYDSEMPQWLAQLDHLVSAFRPERLFLGRHKAFHFRVWYKGPLADYVREMLLDAKTLSRPFLKRSAVHAIVGGHIRGKRNYTSEIHTLLTMELIHRLFIDAR
jgi:asparagine synthase (glutamine-hydrolysing)